jgi:hypothetical protein
MDSKGKFGLIYADEFSVACKINNFKKEEVLQYFINRASFYAFNGGEMDAAALCATRVVLDCKEACKAQPVPVTDRKVQYISLKYIALLSDLDGNIYLSTADKMKESFSLMKEWEAEMVHYVDYAKTFELDEDHFLILTFDFNLLCNMNGVTAREVLQYIINGVSLAKERAAEQTDNMEKDVISALFRLMVVSRSMKRERMELEQDIFDWFSDRLLSLDERLKNEEDINKKISVYKAFYLDWYNTLKRNVG